ncbi:MAG: hypothetical protein IJ071_12735 [Ruminococcus sp.]|nr:hypothetical protein [Ruminococcus sp.]
MNEMNRPIMMLPKQISEEFGIPIYRIRKWVAEGRIVYVPCGRRALINKEKFVAFLNGELNSEAVAK